MPKYLLPVVLALLVAAPGIAMAATTTTAAKPPMTAAKPAMTASAQTVTGTVKAFMPKTHQLKLDNGVTYMLPANFKNPGIRVGSKVTVKWQKKGMAYDATSVSLG